MSASLGPAAGARRRELPYPRPISGGLEFNVELRAAHGGRRGAKRGTLRLSLAATARFARRERSNGELGETMQTVGINRRSLSEIQGQDRDSIRS